MTPQARLFEERTFYVLLVRLKKPAAKDLPEALVKLPAYLHKLVETHVYVAAGEWSSHEGGMILVRCETLAEAERIARQHPFYGKKFAEVEVFEWSARWGLWNLMGAGAGPRRRALKKAAAV